LLSAYALAFNKQENRHGSLFQKRFKRVALNSEYRFYYILCYVHHNPIHHYFAKNYEQWIYSSYNTYLIGYKSEVNASKILSMFDANPEIAKTKFLDLHEKFKVDIASSDHLDE
jgi:hypothetical protein